jgi:hypothetical protein
MMQRVMPDLMGMKNILVINDEAHHCYREKPKDADDEDLKGDERKQAEKNVSFPQQPAIFACATKATPEIAMIAGSNGPASNRPRATASPLRSARTPDRPRRGRAKKSGGLGRLPGDIVFQRNGVTFYFPLVTCIIVSIVLSLLFWLLTR